MKSTQTYSTKGEITYLNVLDDGHIALATSNKDYQIISSLTNAQQLFGIHLSNSLSSTRQHNIIFEPSANALLLCEEERAVIKRIDTTLKKVNAKFSKHKDGIESLALSASKRYLLSGGMDGKVLVWDYQSGKYMMRFRSHPDYVTRVAFTPDEKLALSIGYEGAIITSSLITGKSENKTFLHKKHSSALAFISNSCIASGNVDGEVALFDLEIQKVTHRFMTPHGEIFDLLYLDAFNLLLIASAHKKISLYDIASQKLIDTQYIELTSIPTRLQLLDATTLLVAQSSGVVEAFPFYQPKQLTQYIANESFTEFYTHIEENALLRFTPEYERVESLWLKRVKQAKVLLNKKQSAKATALLASFQNVKKFSKECQSLLDDYENLPQLQNFIAAQKFAQAYALVEKHPALSESNPFLKLEAHFTQLFEKAKKMVIQDIKSVNSAKEILKPFQSVPAKSALVLTLLQSPQLFKELLAAIKKRDFTTILHIVANNLQLKESSEYKKAMQLADSVLEVAQQKLNAHEYGTVLEYATLLSSVPQHKDRAKELYNFAKSAQLLNELIAEKKLLDAYVLIDAQPMLKELDKVKLLEKRWAAMIDKLHPYAFKGSVKAIKTVLGDFFLLSSRAALIGNYLKIAYLLQLKKAASISTINNSDIIKGFQTYINLFGADSECVSLLTLVKKVRKFAFDLGEDELIEKEPQLWQTLSNGNVPSQIITLPTAKKEPSS